MAGPFPPGLPPVVLIEDGHPTANEGDVHDMKTTTALLSILLAACASATAQDHRAAQAARAAAMAHEAATAREAAQPSARTYSGAVKVSPREGVGLEVALDENSDGTTETVFLIWTKTPSTVTLTSPAALVTLDATSFRVLPKAGFPARGIVAHLTKKPAAVPASWTVVRDVVGVTITTGEVAKTPADVRGLNAAELAAELEAQRAGLAKVGEELRGSDDPKARALGDVFAEFGDPITNCPGGGPGPCIPPPLPDPGPGGWSWSSCTSQNCAHGVCVSICDWPYQAICACTPGTGVPACSCITNYPRP